MKMKLKGLKENTGSKNKKTGEKSPANFIKSIDIIFNLWYNEFPYCDSMPYCALYNSQEHLITGYGGCQVLIWTN